MKILTWTYEEVEKVLADKRDDKEVAAELQNRSGQAVTTLRNLARMYQKGDIRYVSKTLQKHFAKYFANREQVEAKTEIIVEKPKETIHFATDAKADDCEEMIEKLVSITDDTYGRLKGYLVEIAEISARHQGHALEIENKALLEELKDLRAWKAETEPEMTQLKEFHETAKKSNFARMLHNTFQPRQQKTA